MYIASMQQLENDDGMTNLLDLKHVKHNNTCRFWWSSMTEEMKTYIQKVYYMDKA